MAKATPLELRVEAPLSKLRRLAELRAELADRKRVDAAQWFGDPTGWAEAHGVWLWSKPREILDSVRDNRLTVARSGVGISKTHTAAVATGWWIDTRSHLGTVRVVTTSASWAQVRGELWQEINRLHQSAELPGRVTQTEWWIGTDMVGLGRKPSDYDATGLHGYHAEYVLVIIDEIGGVPQPLIDAARGLATGDEDRILALGNPDFQGSTFDRLCGPGSAWHPIHMDVLDSPNFTGEDVPEGVARALTGREFVDGIIRDYGEDSAVYQAKVRGQFPQDADDGVVRWSVLAKLASIRTYIVEPPEEPIHLGVDVGAGGDESVIRERRGPRVGRVWRDRQPDTMRVVGLVVNAIHETGASTVKVDATGIGKGVADRLRELGTEGAHQAEIVEVMVGSASSEPHRFGRLRDQLWWEIGRELTESGGWDFATAQDAEPAMAQLCAPKYHHDSSGRVVVEKKTETRSRLGRSPDDADALLLAFYEPATGGGISTSALIGAGSIRRR